MTARSGESRRWRRSVATPTNVLIEDRELADAVPAEHRDRATQAARTGVLHIEPGIWNATDDAQPTAGGYGLLVLDGILVRRVGVRDRIGAELLGPWDLLRPLEHDGEEATLPFEATWRVLAASRLAILDRRWSHRMAPFPEVGITLVGRAMLRARRLVNTFAIAQQPRLDARLHLLLWQLADRFGTVHVDGTHLDLPLTHELLGCLVGARRPSVSGALGRLAQSGAIKRTHSGWVIHGDPPG